MKVYCDTENGERTVMERDGDDVVTYREMMAANGWDFYEAGSRVPVQAFLEMAENIMVESPLIRETVLGSIGLRIGATQEVTKWAFKPLVGVTPQKSQAPDEDE